MTIFLEVTIFLCPIGQSTPGEYPKQVGKEVEMGKAWIRIIDLPLGQ